MILDPDNVLQHFADRRDLMVASICEIVEIDSKSYDAEGSGRVADVVSNWFTEISDRIIVRHIAIDGVGTHLVIEIDGAGSGETALLGHTDTVHSADQRSRNPTRIEGDRLYGLGVFDMKAGIVLMVEAIRYLIENDIDTGRIKIFLACDEEVGSHTGRSIIENELATSERCFVFEPSANGKAKTGRKGTGMYRITARGIPAHAGLEPERGASAILETTHQIQHLHGLNAPERGTTVNVCTISGGTTTNVIPENAEFTVDVRFTSMNEAERIDAAIRRLTAQDDRVSITIDGGINRPPLERDQRAIDLFETVRSTAAMVGMDLGETQVGGASDGNFVAAMGIPVVDGLGVTGDGAHTLDEYILVDDIAPRTALLTLLLADAFDRSIGS